SVQTPDGAQQRSRARPHAHRAGGGARHGDPGDPAQHLVEAAGAAPLHHRDADLAELADEVGPLEQPEPVRGAGPPAGAHARRWPVPVGGPAGSARPRGSVSTATTNRPARARLASIATDRTSISGVRTMTRALPGTRCGPNMVAGGSPADPAGATSSSHSSVVR